MIRRIDTRAPGELVHVDVKKLGKIPAGGGWRKLGRTAGNRNSQADKSSGKLSRWHNPVRGYHCGTGPRRLDGGRAGRRTDGAPYTHAYFEVTGLSDRPDD